MQRATFALIAFLFVAGFAGWSSPASAQEATPSPFQLPEAEALYGLASIQLPLSDEGIAAVFTAMPPAVGGKERAAAPTVEADRVVLSYGAIEPGFGPPLYIQAIDFSRNDFFPADFTADMYVATVSGISDFGAVMFGQDGDLAWVLAASSVAVPGANEATPVAQRPIYTMTWGYAGSSWLFSAATTDPDDLEALVFAFVLTAGMTPAAAATPAAS